MFILLFLLYLANSVIFPLRLHRTVTDTDRFMTKLDETGDGSRPVFS